MLSQRTTLSRATCLSKWNLCSPLVLHRVGLAEPKLPVCTVKAREIGRVASFYSTLAWRDYKCFEQPSMTSVHTCCSLVAKSCATLCDPMDCHLLGPSVYGISQARRLEWVAISFSRGSSQPRDWTCISCIGRWFLYHRATREACPHTDNRNSPSSIRVESFSLCFLCLVNADDWISVFS